MAYKIKKYTGKPSYNLSTRTQTPKYIVVHYTGGNGTASDNVRYFRGGNRDASADFFIDSKSIWRFNPNCKKYYSWHCGDGHGAYGISNANSIGIEVVSTGKPYTDGEKKRLRYLVRLLMEKYGIKEDHVVRHYDASRKLCPLPYAGTAAKEKAWRELRQYIVKG